MGQPSVHDRRIHHLALHPTEIGLDNIVITATEVNFLNGQQLVAQPDIIAVTQKGAIYVVEYKGTQRHAAHAVEQLKAAEKFLYEHFGYKPHKLYVHGKYKVERVR